MPQASLLSFFPRVHPNHEVNGEVREQYPSRSRDEDKEHDRDSKATDHAFNDPALNPDQPLTTPNLAPPTPVPPLPQPYMLPSNPQITIQPVQSDHLPALARLTSALLPIPYQPSFYTSTLTDDGARTFSFEAIYTPPPPLTSNPQPAPPAQPIGWIRCALHPIPTPSARQHDVYIKALLIHPAYRTLGIASTFLHQILHSPDLTRFNVAQISAHVWEENGEALEWYVKRGFERGEFVEGYYRRLRPGGAWVVRMAVERLDNGQ